MKQRNVTSRLIEGIMKHATRYYKDISTPTAPRDIDKLNEDLATILDLIKKFSTKIDVFDVKELGKVVADLNVAQTIEELKKITEGMATLGPPMVHFDGSGEVDETLRTMEQHLKEIKEAPYESPDSELLLQRIKTYTDILGKFKQFKDDLEKKKESMTQHLENLTGFDVGFAEVEIDTLAVQYVDKACDEPDLPEVIDADEARKRAAHLKSQGDPVKRVAELDKEIQDILDGSKDEDRFQKTFTDFVNELKKQQGGEDDPNQHFAMILKELYKVVSELKTLKTEWMGLSADTKEQYLIQRGWAVFIVELIKLAEKHAFPKPYWCISLSEITRIAYSIHVAQTQIAGGVDKDTILKARMYLTRAMSRLSRFLDTCFRKKTKFYTDKGQLEPRQPDGSFMIQTDGPFYIDVHILWAFREMNFIDAFQDLEGRHNLYAVINNHKVSQTPFFKTSSEYKDAFKLMFDKRYLTFNSAFEVTKDFGSIATFMNLGSLLASASSKEEKKGDIVLFSIGVSGSGKSTTLLGLEERPGVVMIAIREYLRRTKRKTIGLRILEIHGVAMDETTETDWDANSYEKWYATRFTDRMIFQGLDEASKIDQDPVVIEIEDVTVFQRQLGTLLENIEKERRDAKRISKTRMNPQSSRSAIVIEFTTDNSNRFYVVDLPGQEDPARVASEKKNPVLSKNIEPADIKKDYLESDVSAIHFDYKRDTQQLSFKLGWIDDPLLFDKDLFEKLVADITSILKTILPEVIEYRDKGAERIYAPKSRSTGDGSINWITDAELGKIYVDLLRQNVTLYNSNQKVTPNMWDIRIRTGDTNNKMNSEIYARQEDGSFSSVQGENSLPKLKYKVKNFDWSKVRSELEKQSPKTDTLPSITKKRDVLTFLSSGKVGEKSLDVEFIDKVVGKGMVLRQSCEGVYINQQVTHCLNYASQLIRGKPTDTVSEEFQPYIHSKELALLKYLPKQPHSSIVFVVVTNDPERKDPQLELLDGTLSILTGIAEKKRTGKLT